MEPQGSKVALDFISFGRASGVEFKMPLLQLIEQLELMPAKSTEAVLTLLGWDNTVAILQTAFSNQFSWLKMVVFLFKFEVCCQDSKWEWVSIGSGNILAPNRQDITWTNDDQFNDTHMPHSDSMN